MNQDKVKNLNARIFTLRPFNNTNAAWKFITMQIKEMGFEIFLEHDFFERVHRHADGSTCDEINKAVVFGNGEKGSLLMVDHNEMGGVLPLKINFFVENNTGYLYTNVNLNDLTNNGKYNLELATKFVENIRSKIIDKIADEIEDNEDEFIRDEFFDFNNLDNQLDYIRVGNLYQSPELWKRFEKNLNLQLERSDFDNKVIVDHIENDPLKRLKGINKVYLLTIHKEEMTVFENPPHGIIALARLHVYTDDYSDLYIGSSGNINKAKMILELNDDMDRNFKKDKRLPVQKIVDKVIEKTTVN